MGIVFSLNFPKSGKKLTGMPNKIANFERRAAIY
jgi:hypothetical protein